MANYTKLLSLLTRQPAWRWLAALGVVLVAAALVRGSAKNKDVGATFIAQRGPLDIVVLQGGSIESEEKGEIKCEVKGGQGVKILKIVEEGYAVTEEDVKTNKVLVEVDSSDLKNKITQQDINFGSTAASLIDAQQAYDIQLNQNLSDVKAAEQKVTFNRMDFERYVGDRAANEIVTQLGLKPEATAGGTSTSEALMKAAADLAAAPPTNAPPAATNQAVAVAAVQGSSPTASNAPVIANLTHAPSPAGQGLTNAAPPASAATIDFSQYADLEKLGDGEAKQKMRELRDAVQIAQKELQQAKSTLEGTRRLFEKDFVTKIELDRDQLTYDNKELNVQKTGTALNLFVKYEFRKAAQQALSTYAESLRELDRTRKGAVSKLAQADAKLKSAQAKYTLERDQLKELREQLEKCVIKARRPGLVVYGSGGEVRYWRNEEQIREGATVREGQTVLTVPDMRKMCIKVKIHESYIKQIQKGQCVRITADAFPDRKLEGEVSQVGVLPDSDNSWLNPDMKVYRTTIAIRGQHDWIRPGMSTKVQILVNQLTNVVYVPIQAVSPVGDKKVCYVVNRNKVEQRPLQVGEFNDEFIEVKQGVKEGERVCLRAPAGTEPPGAGKAMPATAPKAKPENKVAAKT